MKTPPTDPNADPDRDGLSNYEEMLLWRNPNVPEDLPTILSSFERQLAAEAQEIERQKHDAQALLDNREFIQRAQATMEKAQAKDQLFRQQVKHRKEDLTRLSQILKQKTDRELAQGRLRLKRDQENDFDRRKGTLMGIDSRGRPKFHKTYNLDAAIAIQAKPLWSGESSPLPDLDGSGVTVGIWDEGAVMFTHLGLANRVILGESEADFRIELGITDPDESIVGPHATRVAGTLGAGFGISSKYRGIAQNVLISSYHSVNDFSEMGIAAKNGMIFSNHSYGTFAGWWTNYIWRGPHALAGEDPEFGAYTSDTKTLDALAYLAPNYLSVWASGNEAVNGLGRTEGQAPDVDADGDGDF